MFYMDWQDLLKDFSKEVVHLYSSTEIFFSDLFSQWKNAVLSEENRHHFNFFSQLRTEGNACYHSVQNLVSSSLLSKNLKIKIYRTIILPVVLYGCETWSLILRQNVGWGFSRTVLRRICGPKRDKVGGEWRKLHNKELYTLYCS
jgi:hypothetical protein